MRLAALAVPSATGSFTENGNRIGDITLGGSLALIIFVGLLASLFFATIWVTISPWLPGPSLVKGLLAAPIAVAFGSIALIDSNNPDFVVLRHDPLVVAILLTTVALTGPAMALTDSWLDRRLPAAGSPTSSTGTTYALLSTVGAIFGSILTLQAAASPSPGRSGSRSSRSDSSRSRGGVFVSGVARRRHARWWSRRGPSSWSARSPVSPSSGRRSVPCSCSRSHGGRRRGRAGQLAMTTRVASARRCA